MLSSGYDRWIYNISSTIRKNNFKKFWNKRKSSYICSPKNKSNRLRVVIRCA